MPESYALNEYIINGKGDPKKLMAGMYFWTWNTQEVLDMIEWMRNYNVTANRKVMFTGFDMQTVLVARNIVRQYVKRNQPSLIQNLDNYDSLVKNRAFNEAELKKVSRSLKAYAQLLFDSIRIHQPTTKDSSFTWALQNVKILLQYAGNIKNDPARDESMAENVKWILDQNPDAKMVIWAHNGHIRKAKDGFEYKSMGEYLNKLYGKQMVAIGFSTSEGTYTAVQRDGKKFIGLDSTNSIFLNEDSYENILRTADPENFILDLRNVSNNPAANGWLSEKKYFLTIGAMAMDKSQFQKIHIRTHFDMLIFIRKTSASKCFFIKKLAGN